MTNALIIIILLAVLAFTFASYSRLGDILDRLEQQGDSLTGTLYKLTEIRNNANDAGKKAVEALGNIHDTLKGTREITREVILGCNNRLSFMSDRLEYILGDVNYIKSLYEKAAEEAERVSAEEGKETDPDPQSEPEQENEPEAEPEPQPEPEPETEPETEPEQINQ